MRKLIYEFDEQNKIIYVLEKRRKKAYHLTLRLFKLFSRHLKKGVLIDFETGNKRITKGVLTQNIRYFNQIVSLVPYQVIYDLESLRENMVEVLNNHEYYLFLDFEMSMPGYDASVKFTPEIIQAGFVLSKAFEAPIIKDSFYLQTHSKLVLSRRAIKFLNINQETYDQKARPFLELHLKLKKIYQKYRPKIVIWGKNDETVFMDTYKNYKLKPFLNHFDFMDLLKLHKDYYNLENDIGLFKAYKMYFNDDLDQAHNAYEDALITKHVFDGFLATIIK